MADISLHKKALILIEHIVKVWDVGDESDETEAFKVFMIAHAALGECNKNHGHSEWVDLINVMFQELVDTGIYDPRQKKAGLN